MSMPIVVYYFSKIMIRMVFRCVSKDILLAKEASKTNYTIIIVSTIRYKEGVGIVGLDIPP